ncbi:MAG: CoA pyrophosphatase [Candidatus Schekmanbacteria bacterium]|nr:CoA pyrophosphatase [Candidatus Schekmanbacteria bacterium]
MTDLTVQRVRGAFRHYRPRSIPGASLLKQAAVAAILREGADGRGAEFLLIRRAEHPQDPWSGHMAFPGGRRDETDADSLAAAIRETQEEVGLDLQRHADRIGRLSHLMARAQGRPLPMVIVPYLFHLAPDAPVELQPSSEVAEIVWVPLAFLANPANRESFAYRVGGLSMPLPCIFFGGRKIWGLTLRMIDELLGAVR